jgi:hypothetical protein
MSLPQLREERVDEFESQQAGELPQISTPSPRWTGAPSIDLVHQLNRQCIDLVCELAANSSCPELPKFVLRNRDLWRLLEPEARQRVAAFPFVIVDLRFKDAEAWRRASDGHLMSVTDCTLCNDTLGKFFEDLVLEALLFARQTAREDISVAKAMFAMTSRVVGLIASLTLSQVRAIALGNARQLRVRWDNDPEFWCDLLVASRADDELAISALRRHGKLLYCGELIRK